MIDPSELPPEVRKFLGLDKPVDEAQAKAAAQAEAALEDIRSRIGKDGLMSHQRTLLDNFRITGTMTFHMPAPEPGIGKLGAFARQCEDRMHRVGQPRQLPEIKDYKDFMDPSLGLAYVEELPAGSKLHEAIAKKLYPETP